MSKTHWFQKTIFIGYNPDNTLSVIFYRAMVLFFTMNIIISCLYWYSHLAEKDMSFLFLNINMPDDMYVLYFASNVAYSLIITFPATLFLFVIQVFIERKKGLLSHALPLPDSSWIKRMYHNEVKSFLLPTKNGRLNVLIALLGSLAIMGAMIIIFLPIVYTKLSNEELYATLLNLGVQSEGALLTWNLIMIVFYHITIQIMLSGLQMFYITLFKKQSLERMMQKI